MDNFLYVNSVNKTWHRSGNVCHVMMFCGMGLRQMTYDASRIYAEVRCIQGYHVDQEIWDTSVGEVLPSDMLSQ